MKYLILGGFLMAAFASNSLQAQEQNAKPSDNQQPVAVQSQPLKDPLALTREQQIPFREITKRYAELMREVRVSSLPPNEKRQKIETIQTEKDAEVKGLLTPDQYKVYQQQREERKAKYLQLRK